MEGNADGPGVPGPSHEPVHLAADRRYIATGDEAIGALNEVLVVLATATIRDLPTEVRLGTEHGMPRECALNLDHVDTGHGGQGIHR